LFFIFSAFKEGKEEQKKEHNRKITETRRTRKGSKKHQNRVGKTRRFMTCSQCLGLKSIFEEHLDVAKAFRSNDMASFRESSVEGESQVVGG